MAELTRLRQEWQDAVRRGAPQEEIAAKEKAYNTLLEKLRGEYGL